MSEPTRINVITIGQKKLDIPTISFKKIPVLAVGQKTLEIKTTAPFPDFPNNPTGTLALNSIVTPTEPGEVLFDYTTEDIDGTVVKIELLRKESAESVFTEVAEILSPGSSGQISDTAVDAGTYEYKLLITDDEALTGESNVVAGVVIGSAVSIITFDAADQTIANGADVPTGIGLLKAQNGASGVTEIVSNEGRIRTSSGSDTAWFMGQVDLLTVRGDGTWKLTTEFTGNSFVPPSPAGTFMPLMISITIVTVPQGSGFTSNMLFDIDFAGADGNIVVFRYSQFGNLDKVAGIFSSIYVKGTKVVLEIEVTAADVLWTFDKGGPNQRQACVAFTDIKTHSTEFPYFGNVDTTFGGVIDWNDITWQ